MKNLISTLSLLVCICLTASTLQATSRVKSKKDSLICLQIEGKISNLTESDDDSCIVELISAKDGIDTIVLLDGQSRFKFSLKKNTSYGIRISRKGYITKLISVNTELLAENNFIHRFLFETRLIKEAALKRLNRDVIDFPIAIIYFDYDKDAFSYNKEYTSYIKREMFKNNPNTEIAGIASNSSQTKD